MIIISEFYIFCSNKSADTPIPLTTWRFWYNSNEFIDVALMTKKLLKVITIRECIFCSFSICFFFFWFLIHGWCWLQCKVCMQTFICTTSEVKCREHAEAKHPKSDVYACFPHLKKWSYIEECLSTKLHISNVFFVVKFTAYAKQSLQTCGGSSERIAFHNL